MHCHYVFTHHANVKTINAAALYTKPFSDLFLSAAVMSSLSNEAKHLTWNAKVFINLMMSKQFNKLYLKNDALEGITKVYILTHGGLIVIQLLYHQRCHPPIKGQRSLM